MNIWKSIIDVIIQSFIMGFELLSTPLAGISLLSILVSAYVIGVVIKAFVNSATSVGDAKVKDMLYDKRRSEHESGDKK